VRVSCYDLDVSEAIGDAAIDYRVGIPEAHREAAAALYLAVFARLLRPVLGRRDAVGLGLLAPALDLERAIAAIARRDDRDGDGEEPEPGELVGICGLHFGGRHLVALEVRPLLRAFGLVGGVRRILVGGLLDRRPRRGELVIDGIAVAPQARGVGIGRGLLGALDRFAAASPRDFSGIVLDVASDNQAALRLYDRAGYLEIERRAPRLVRAVYGIPGIVTMRRPVARSPL
jgi:ribosomal protein S18 acetylase RimI-like enzyme